MSKQPKLYETDWVGSIHSELLSLVARYPKSEVERRERAVREYMHGHEWDEQSIEWALPRVLGKRVAGEQTLEEALGGKVSRVVSSKRAVESKKVGKPGVVEFRLRETVAQVLMSKAAGSEVADIVHKAEQVKMHFGVSYKLAVSKAAALLVLQCLHGLRARHEAITDKYYIEAIERVELGLAAAESVAG